MINIIFSTIHQLLIFKKKYESGTELNLYFFNEYKFKLGANRIRLLSCSWFNVNFCEKFGLIFIHT